MNTVWVTGALGFIGQHLSLHLADCNQSVYGIGHGTCPPETAARQGLNDWINGDLDANNLNQLLKKSGPPDVIYHLAGGSSVGASILSPTEDFRRSVATTSSLLEWVRVHSAHTKFVMASSAAVYGNSALRLIPEEGQYVPFSPYGFHKRAAELICESYAQAFGLSIRIVRLFSVYGTGLRKQLLWDVCCKLHKKPARVTLHGTGNETRDWLNVKDAVRLMQLVGNDNTASSLIINGGTGFATAISSIVTLVRDAMKSDSIVEFNGVGKAGDPFSLVADTTKATQLGFQPKYSLEQGLMEYVEWFRQAIAI